MAANAVWLRGVPFGWALPGSLLALVILGWELLLSVPLVPALLPTALVLMVALAASAAWHGVHVGTVPLDRALLWALFAGLLAAVVAVAGLHPRGGTVLLVTGVLAFVIGIEMARSIPARLQRAVKRLIDRNVLEVTPEGRGAFEERLEQRVRPCAFAGGLVVAATILVAWLVVMSGWSAQGRRGSLWLVVFECLCGWVAGERLGRMVAYGVLLAAPQPGRRWIAPRPWPRRRGGRAQAAGRLLLLPVGHRQHPGDLPGSVVVVHPTVAVPW